MLYSEHKEKNAFLTEQVALMLPVETDGAFTNWESQLLNYHGQSISVMVLCYSSTNDAEEAMKEDFCNKLQNMLDKERLKKSVS